MVFSLLSWEPPMPWRVIGDDRGAILKAVPLLPESVAFCIQETNLAPIRERNDNQILFPLHAHAPPVNILMVQAKDSPRVVIFPDEDSGSEWLEQRLVLSLPNLNFTRSEPPLSNKRRRFGWHPRVETPQNPQQ